MRSFAYIFVVVVFVVCSYHTIHCTDEPSTMNLDDLLHSLQRPSTNVPYIDGVTSVPSKNQICEHGYKCVPEQTCVNGIIISGEGQLDARYDDEGDSEHEICPEHHSCCVVPSREPKVHHKCGVRCANGAFPWAVTIHYHTQHKYNGANMSRGVGSLIHPSVVMTVGHRIADLSEYSKIKVKAGKLDGEWDPNHCQERGVSDIVIHEHFGPRNLHNDIALIFLDAPFDMNDDVSTVCLPPQDYSFDHQRCLVKNVEVPVVPKDSCQDKLRLSRLGMRFNLDESFICAGGEEKYDTCQGDGGASLNCHIPDNAHDQYYAAGQVAWGIGCFDAIPAAYVNVASFRHWIDGLFHQRNLDTKYYTL